MRLKVMTFNEADDRSMWVDKKGQVLDIINSYSPDFVGLQEVATITLKGVKEAEIYENGYSVPIDLCLVQKRYLQAVHSYKVVNDHEYSMTASDHFAVVSDLTVSF